jgi:hypothetical protein
VPARRARKSRLDGGSERGDGQVLEDNSARIADAIGAYNDSFPTSSSSTGGRGGIAGRAGAGGTAGTPVMGDPIMGAMGDAYGPSSGCTCGIAS